MSSDFLFSMPSLYAGVARVLDLGSQFDSYNYAKSPEQADALAFAHDLARVGRDIGEPITVGAENEAEDSEAEE